MIHEVFVCRYGCHCAGPAGSPCAVARRSGDPRLEKALDRRTGDPLGGSSVLRRNRAVDEWLQQAIAGVHERRATGEMIDSCPHQGTEVPRFQEGASRHEISRGI
jgi:hypothetical protein